MFITKPGTVTVNEGDILIHGFSFDGEGESCGYYKTAIAACEWAKAEIDRELEKMLVDITPEQRNK